MAYKSTSEYSVEVTLNRVEGVDIVDSALDIPGKEKELARDIKRTMTEYFAYLVKEDFIESVTVNISLKED